MGHGRAPDKMDKTDSNRRRTVSISLTRSVTGFGHVQKVLTDVPNVNGHGMDTPNDKCIRHGH